MNNIIDKDPQLIETLQHRMTDYNLEVSESKIEQQELMKQQDIDLEIKKENDNNFKMNM